MNKERKTFVDAAASDELKNNNLDLVDQCEDRLVKYFYFVIIVYNCGYIRFLSGWNGMIISFCY